MHQGQFYGVGRLDDSRRLIHQDEDTFHAGDGVLDIGPQHRDLLHRLVETLHVGDERDHQTDGDGRAKQGLVAQQHEAADAGHQGQRSIAERLKGRS